MTIFLQRGVANADKGAEVQGSGMGGEVGTQGGRDSVALCCVHIFSPLKRSIAL